MQQVKTAVSIVSYVMGVPATRVNTIARELLDAGILPKSRGRDIKKIDAEQLAALVVAVAMADVATEAPDVARRVTKMRRGGEGVAFGKFFASCMDSSVSTFPDLELSRTAAGFVAMFTLEVEGEKGGVAFWEARSWGGWTKRSVTLSRHGFEVLRNLFIRDDIDGMEFKKA